TDDEGARVYVTNLAEDLKDNGFKVVRRKIESAPFHPAAPMRGSGVIEMPAGCYFEVHINAQIQADSEDQAKAIEGVLSGIAKTHKGHFSR
ncbi:hypothetical protein, partial [Vibrio cholerae]|uniref:hypothetical protein n=1 Tax=Vibrio cholerae TaxID=666 RepID=UPI00301BE373